MSAARPKRHLEIRKLDHLSLRLGIALDELIAVASSINQYYIVRKLRKKNGGFRTISAPQPRLKRIQLKIHKLLKEIIIDDAAHCGIKGRSNLSNAKQHTNKPMLLNLDLSSFFPSISHHLVYNMFVHSLKCSPAVSRILTRLSTYNGEVPQGGPMSTDIANLICWKIDKRLSGLARKNNITYTRYCDDLSFSGQTISEPFITKVKGIISESGFKLNAEKESFHKRTNSTRIVTGLSVNGPRPKIPKSALKKLRAEIHIFDKYESHSLTEQLLEKRQKQIRGKISYRNYIEKN